MTGPVRSVSQAFAIMRLLADSGAMTLSDIGRGVGLSPSSCLNLLKTLVREGAIERDARLKHYRLAAPWLAVEALHEHGAAQFADRARAPMARFAQSSEAAVGLWKVVSRDRMQLVARAESDAGTRLSLADEQRQPLGSGAAGRALAAAQGVAAAELARRHAGVRWQTDLPFDTYAKQVSEASTRGFAIDRGLTLRGVSTVGVAIADMAPAHCLSASVFAGSRSDAEIDALGRGLVDLRADLLARTR